MIRRAAVVGAIALLVPTTVPASAGVSLEEPVKDGPADQFGPSAEGDAWFGWTQFMRPLYTARAQMLPDGGAQVLRKRAGAHTFFGDFDPSSDEAIFQDNGGRNVDANVYVADLGGSGAISGPGSGINTEHWEWGPEISANFILFGRNRFASGSSPWKVILYDRDTQRRTVLDEVENRCGCIFPQDVNERYATWVKCAVKCNVFVYDTQDETTTKIHNPDRFQYAASLSEEGRVYFVRSGRGCGANVQIRATDVEVKDETSLLVYRYEDGTELASSIHVVDGIGGVHDLYFDRADCSDERFRGNIYRIPGVFSETTVTSSAAVAADGATGGGGGRRMPARPDARPVG